jgi:hypothetical protein
MLVLVKRASEYMRAARDAEWNGHFALAKFLREYQHHDV